MRMHYTTKLQTSKKMLIWYINTNYEEMIKENNSLKIRERNCCYYFYPQPVCDRGIQAVKENRLSGINKMQKSVCQKMSSGFIS